VKEKYPDYSVGHLQRLVREIPQVIEKNPYLRGVLQTHVLRQPSKISGQSWTQSGYFVIAQSQSINTVSHMIHTDLVRIKESHRHLEDEVKCLPFGVAHPLGVPLTQGAVGPSERPADGKAARDCCP
jgi:hypothetical protein